MAKQKNVDLKKYTDALAYINNYVKLPSKYSNVSIAGDVSKIDDNNKEEFIKTKLYEILLTLSTTDRTSLVFMEDNDSKLLRNIWQEENDYYIKNVGKLNSFK